ncbi:MAG: HXXEE domain-containing protein [Woeseia sp.]|nr:HXXEE domain-containing protein [Woeseia sp.]
MWSAVPSVIVLGLVAVVAAVFARKRSSPVDAAAERVAASTVLAITTAIQGAHFAEEWSTGFHVRFPALLGLDPMPLSFFVFFNLAWITIWIVSPPFLRHGRRSAFFAAWFLAIAGMLNGVAHPMMAIISGGYFPGLITSPFIGIAAVFLWRRLREATSERLQDA